MGKASEEKVPQPRKRPLLYLQQGENNAFFSDVYALFAISPTTLRRWCRRAYITFHRDPADYRRRYLDNDLLLKLARLHPRVLIVNAETARLDYLQQIETRIAKLEEEHQDRP